MGSLSLYSPPPPPSITPPTPFFLFLLLLLPHSSILSPSTLSIPHSPFSLSLYSSKRQLTLYSSFSLPPPPPPPHLSLGKGHRDCVNIIYVLSSKRQFQCSVLYTRPPTYYPKTKHEAPIMVPPSVQSTG